MNTAAATVTAQSAAQQTEQKQPVEPLTPVSEVKASSNSPEVTGEKEELSVEQLEAAIEKLNELMKDSQRSLSFSVDRDLDKVVVQVKDSQTDEVIRQIPNEETLNFAKNLEGVIGVIFNDHA
ncbi:flagellar protein FlaG [Marinobacterium arenosum]|uniref:flagellar protein FlaG n=1 Tax=Marinobacterium arenosum TaxID=2862496 RepID=UPI001C987FC9|nr:flagellar protein FlaG [Marinobacterium arenosum]MBY4675931.1 flagellar protein FlaG [Marinobacterium arenosum]